MSNSKRILVKIWSGIILLSFCIGLKAQSDFPYKLHLEPFTIEGLDGLHAFAFGQVDGTWVILGGRRDGIHARQPFNAFPAAHNNTTIYVVDPLEQEVWTAEVQSLPLGIKEQMQSTNMQFFQEENLLFFLGGYGYSESEGDHITYPKLTAIDLEGLIEDMQQGNSIAEHFTQITDDNFAVTGGNLGKIGAHFFLVGGHRFDGRYNPMNHPTFTQEYTNQIRKFKINTIGGLSYSDYSTIRDEVHLHRRDYNLVPQIFPDGNFGYTLFSGVFQYNQDLPFLYPVDIRSDTFAAITDFNQMLSHYHSANIALFDSLENVMHTLFLGGISQYYLQDGYLIKDDDVPFVKTISRVSRAADGSLEEVALPQSMPGYLGAGAAFILNEELPKVAADLLSLDRLQGDSILLGHILGGIESPAQHPFTFNNTAVTFASNTLFRVYLIPDALSSDYAIALPGYHPFEVTVFPSPVSDSFFMANIQSPEPGAIEVLLSNMEGKLIINQLLTGVEEGKNLLELDVSAQAEGVYILTIVLNGKYFSSEKIVIQK